MAKLYRTRTQTIAALRWHRDAVSVSELREFTNNLVMCDSDEVPAWEAQWAVYNRLEDFWEIFQNGDYIVRGTQGQFYVMNSDEFHIAFESVVGFLDD